MFSLPVFESVRLEGFIMGPVTGTVSFQATGDDFFRLTVDGATIMDTVSLEDGPSSSILTGETDMKEVNVRCFEGGGSQRWHRGFVSLGIFCFQYAGSLFLH